jgi:hypothetical protein
LCGQAPNEQAQTALADVEHRVVECRQFLSERLVALEVFDSRSTDLARRLSSTWIGAIFVKFSTLS